MIIGLQLLRFIAAALVVLTHTRVEFDDLTPFGAFGVDIFFVISGFIISFITQSSTNHFLVRRFIRIVPMYWLFTLCFAALAVVAPSLLNSGSFDPKHLLSSLLFYPYFTEKLTFSPMLRLGWTLNLEMFFYLLFLVAMKISHRYRELICMLFLLPIPLLSQVIVFESGSPLWFYAKPIVLEFALGMLVAVVYRWYLTGSYNRAFVAKVAMLACIPICVYFYVAGGEKDLRLLEWGVPSTLLVLAVILSEPYYKRLPVFVVSAIILLGEISYPVYLVHLYIVGILSRLLNFNNGSLTIFFLVALLITGVISYVVSEFFDKFVRRILNSKLSQN